MNTKVGSVDGSKMGNKAFLVKLPNDYVINKYMLTKAAIEFLINSGIDFIENVTEEVVDMHVYKDDINIEMLNEYDKVMPLYTEPFDPFDRNNKRLSVTFPAAYYKSTEILKSNLIKLFDAYTEPNYPIYLDMFTCVYDHLREDFITRENYFLPLE